MATIPPSQASEADYAWEVATLFPAQGYWSEDAYLDLTDGTNRRIELVDGRLEFLPMPTELHQALVEFLFFALRAFVKNNDLGFVPFPPPARPCREQPAAGQLSGTGYCIHPHLNRDSPKT